MRPYRLVAVLLSSCLGLGLEAPQDRHYPLLVLALVLVLNHLVFVQGWVSAGKKSISATHEV